MEIEILPAYFERAREAVLKKFESAHQRLAISGEIDGALRASAYYGCGGKIEVWADAAYGRLGGKLTDHAAKQVVNARLVGERRQAVFRGEQASLSGLSGSDYDDVAFDLDRPAYEAFRKERVERIFPLFRAKFHAAKGTPDSDLAIILRWALDEIKNADTWKTNSWSGPDTIPKGTQTRKRTELIAMLQQTKARIEQRQVAKLERGSRVGKPARELGVVLAAYAGLTDGARWQVRQAAPGLLTAIEASEAWKAWRRGG
jgi:hypothetical protein